MSAPRQPCDRILWYVSGNLEPAMRHEFEAHLPSCDRCREDAETFGSMMRSLRRQSMTDHIPAEDLIAWDEEAPLSEARRRTIASHLTSCASCREDREHLARARPREARTELTPLRAVPSARSTAGARGGRSRYALAAACFAGGAGLVLGLLALSGLPLGTDGGAPAPLMELRSIVFQAPLRSVEPPRILRAPGPWALRVILPFGAPVGDWEVAIVSAEGAAVRPSIGARTDGAGQMSLLLGPGLAPGGYRLIARSRNLASEPATIYPFQVSGEPSR